MLSQATVDLQDYGLKDNPFALMPRDRVTEWAGMEEVRNKLEDVVRSVLAGDVGLSEFVLVHGEYGAGKTHALKYLTTLINEVESESFQARAIYMPKVKVAPKLSFVALYFEIMREFGRDFVRHLGRRIQERVEEATTQIARGTGPNAPEGNARALRQRGIAALPEDDQPMVRVLLAIAEGRDEALTYLFEGAPAVEEAGYTEKIDSSYMATKVLSALLRVMTLSIRNQPPAYQAVHLFIDDVDEVLEARSAEQADLWFAIRELVNSIPRNFALILAFTAETALLEAVLPESLETRTSRRPIELRALDLDSARRFVRQQIKNHRPEAYSPPQPYHPFTEEAVDYVLEQVVTLVPRKIFRALHQVMERAIRRHGIEPGEEISAEVAQDIVMRMGI
mgnify:CR=1 FL=1